VAPLDTQTHADTSVPRSRYDPDMPIYAADVQAIAESVTALTVVGGFLSWTWHRRKTMSEWFTRKWRSQVTAVISDEVTAGVAWQAVSETPEVSMEAGIAYARTAAQSGHPPWTVTQGRVAPDQPLGYLLAKTAETVWAAASAAHSELEPYLVPVRNYMTALIAKVGVSAARDFALGVLTERVRQEEDGWPDQPGDPRGRRSAHGTGAGHLCLLEQKHQVEDAIYEVSGP
jgi:hypothetical protein